MLLSLHIENIAVIKTLDLDLSDGFSIFTGETGAGKSIIIDSINLLLGAKSDRELVRNGAKFAMVSGFFTNLNETAISLLKDNGVYADDDGNILIQRTVYADGKSQIKINGRTVTLSILRSIMPALVAIHGQNDTASISASEKQLEIIDLYENNEELLNEYSVAYNELEDIRHKITDIQKKESERERLTEILEYQIKDIDSLEAFGFIETDDGYVKKEGDTEYFIKIIGENVGYLEKISVCIEVVESDDVELSENRLGYTYDNENNIVVLNFEKGTFEKAEPTITVTYKF